MNTQNTQRRFVDFHTHSNASDGSFPPAEIIRQADAAGLYAVALTDHDTTAGLPAAAEEAKKFPNLKFVPGIEVSAAFPDGTLHIIGLGIDPDSPSIKTLAGDLTDARTERNPKMLQKLADLGMPITMENVMHEVRLAGNQKQDAIVGRLHVAKALVRAGHVKTTDEAFAKYLGMGKPAFVDKEKLAPREVIAAIHDAGGVAILAHPPELNYKNDAQLEQYLRNLMAAGIDGLEVYHTDNSDYQSRFFLKLAHRFDLTPSGGSDFHGLPKPYAKIGKPKVPVASLGKKIIDILNRL